MVALVRVRPRRPPLGAGLARRRQATRFFMLLHSFFGKEFSVRRLSAFRSRHTPRLLRTTSSVLFSRSQIAFILVWARANTQGVIAVLSPVKVIAIDTLRLMSEEARSFGEESPRQAVAATTRAGKSVCANHCTEASGDWPPRSRRSSWQSAGHR